MFTVTRADWPSLQSLRTEIGYNYDSVMGRYISIYYGSFMRTCGYLPLPALRKRIEHTLKHEFRHHLESQGGQRDLEIIDDTQIQEYKNQSVSRVNPDGWRMKYMDKEKIALENFKQGLNCAQSVFCVFAQEGGLSREKALLIASCFGGGMRCGEVCGAVTGALMAIGLNFGFTSVQNPADKARANALAVSFEEQFIAKKQTILCRELLGYDLSDPEELIHITEQGLFGSICPQLISEAVLIVEKMFADQIKEPIPADRI